MMRRSTRLQELKPAPGDLRLVQEFLNTADLEAKTDELATPTALAEWLVSQALVSEGKTLHPADVERARAFRESLRSLVAAGEKASHKHATAVEQAAATAHVRARFEAGGQLRFVPVSKGLDGAFGRMLSIIAVAQRDRKWSRFKVCVNCRAAFYDASTNHSGLWCQPRCGVKVRMRDHRRRRLYSGLRG